MSILFEAAVRKIMTAEAYAKQEHETPYVFDINKNIYSLCYFGAHHSADPEDQLFVDIHDALVKNEPDIVFVEGMQTKGINKEIERLFQEMSYTDAIERGGEPVYTAKFATELGIEWRCPEPDDADLYAHLASLPGFSKSHIAAWNTLHVLPQWQRRNEIVNFKDYSEQYRKLLAEKTNWDDFDYSYEYAINFAEQILGKPLRLENRDLAEKLVDPIPWRENEMGEWTIFKRISKASSAFRDEEIVRQIGAELLSRKKVFVVYGASHAVVQEPALRWLLEEHSKHLDK